MIYNVTFRKVSDGRVLTYWFDDKDTAYHFFESVKASQGTFDADIFWIPLCETDTYYDDMDGDFYRPKTK